MKKTVTLIIIFVTSYFCVSCALLKSQPTLTLTTNGVVVDFHTNIVVIPIK